MSLQQIFYLLSLVVFWFTYIYKVVILNEDKGRG